MARPLHLKKILVERDFSVTHSLNILGISGSLRKSSIHSGLLRAFGNALPENAAFAIADLHDIPMYNADIDGPAQPESVVRLKQQVRAADLLVIASPEYNGSYTGALKNAIDWATRPVSESAMSGRHAVVMTSAGRSGGVKNITALRQLLFNVNTNVMLRPEFNLALARAKFSPETGDVIDDELRADIALFVEKCLEWHARQTAWMR